MEPCTKYRIELTLSNGEKHYVEKTWSNKDWLTECRIQELEVLQDVMMRRYMITDSDVAINMTHVVTARVTAKEPAEQVEIPF